MKLAEFDLAVRSTNPFSPSREVIIALIAEVSASRVLLRMRPNVDIQEELPVFVGRLDAARQAAEFAIAYTDSVLENIHG